MQQDTQPSIPTMTSNSHPYMRLPREIRDQITSVLPYEDGMRLSRTSMQMRHESLPLVFRRIDLTYRRLDPPTETGKPTTQLEAMKIMMKSYYSNPGMFPDNPALWPRTGYLENHHTWLDSYPSGDGWEMIKALDDLTFRGTREETIEQPDDAADDNDGTAQTSYPKPQSMTSSRSRALDDTKLLWPEVLFPNVTRLDLKDSYSYRLANQFPDTQRRAIKFLSTLVKPSQVHLGGYRYTCFEDPEYLSKNTESMIEQFRSRWNGVTLHVYGQGIAPDPTEQSKIAYHISWQKWERQFKSEKQLRASRRKLDLLNEPDNSETLPDACVSYFSITSSGHASEGLLPPDQTPSANVPTLYLYGHDKESLKTAQTAIDSIKRSLQFRTVEGTEVERAVPGLLRVESGGIRPLDFGADGKGQGWSEDMGM
jgi:hypothetical protein